MAEYSKIEIHGCGSTERSYFCVHGEGRGLEGVALSQGQVDGVYDAPVRTERRSSFGQRGASLVGTSFPYREVNLGFHVVGLVNGGPDTITAIDSEFRACFTYDEHERFYDPDWKPARIDWTTDHSGTRSLDVLLRDVPDFKPDVDPHRTEHANPILPLAADQPFWYEAPAVRHWETTATSASGFIEMPGNPTPVPAFQKWILTRGKWSIPDVSWRGPRGRRAPGGPDATRMLPTFPVTSTHGGLTIDLDPMELMVRDAHDTNAIAQMPNPGQFFQYVIPPYTPPCWLPISVTNAPAGGARAELVVPRLWSKPWGEEVPMNPLPVMP